MWLPVSLPFPSEPVPTDVALWLFELRHYNDSNDVPGNVKVNVDCDNVADSICELDTQGLKQLSLHESDEEKLQNCHCEVQEYSSTAENPTQREDISGLLIQEEEDYVKICTKEEEVQNCHSELQECLENSPPREEIPGLLSQKEEICVNHRKDKETVNYHCECPENSAPREDIPGFLHRAGGSIHSHKCDFDDVPLLKVYSGMVQENRRVNTDESNTKVDDWKVSQYQVGESPSCNWALRSNSIMWEANPLYCRVGGERTERGFRKLCHSTLEQLGNSIQIHPGEKFKLGSFQINELVSVGVTEENGVACMLKTDHLVCEHGRCSGKCPLKLHSECGSLRERTHIETCQCGADLNTGTCVIDSCVNQTTYRVTDIQKTNSEIYGQDAVQNLQLHQTFVSDTRGKHLIGPSSNNSDCDKAGHCSSIVESFGNDDEVTLSCDEKCKELLHDVELIIQNLDIATGDLSADNEMEPDVDFLKLCQEAQNLAEEIVQQCSVQATPKKKKTRSINLSSDLSDDVFLSSPSSEEHNVMHPLPQEVRRHHSLDINSIFDDGTKPPVPPARTKRNKERPKTIHVTEHRPIDESKGSVTAPECHTGCRSASHLDEIKLSVKEIDNENSSLECQELLIMKRVTESTKEKRSGKVASRYEDRNLCCQGYQACHVPDSNPMNVAVVSDDCSDPLVSGKDSKFSMPDDTVIRKLGDECEEYLNIILTQTRPISSTEFPPSEQQVHNVSSSCDERLQSEAESVETSCDESGILLQNRKGSTSSDITAWKQELQHSGLCYLDDEWDADCMLQPDKVHIQYCGQN
jgi:hypothetical protein